MAILKEATSVETYRIVDTDFQPNPPRSIGTIEQYPITSKGVARGSDFAIAAAEQLLDGEAYFLSLDCIIDPGVAFRFWKSKESVTLVICYQCDHVEVIVCDSWGSTTHRGGAFFSKSFGVMVQLAKKAFPDDPEIQGLK